MSVAGRIGAEWVHGRMQKKEYSNITSTKCTLDEELSSVDAAALPQGGRFMLTHQVAAHFCVTASQREI